MEGSDEAEIQNDQPNILFLLADDLGWSELGFNGGNPDLTPSIDALKESSLNLTQFYVHAVCAPSRAAFLTGRYPFRTWSDWRTEDFGKPSYLDILGLKLTKNEEGDYSRRLHGLAPNEITIAEALGEAGYFTALIGKWGCGEWLDEHLPMAQGFQHQYGHYAWGIDYTNFTIPHNAPARYAVYDWHRNQEPIYEDGYTTDLIASEVISLLSQQADRPNDQPFFFYVPFNAVHGPLEEIPRYRDQYDKRSAAIKCLDDAVGRILKAVDQYGFAENTLVVFTNDNGAIRDTMNFPFRGTKNTNLEGGVRVPCLIRWPGMIEAGISSDALVHITDFYPTFIQLGDGVLPQDRIVDGMDMASVLLNGEPSPREEIIFDAPGCVRLPAMRKRNFKWVGTALYDLNNDPYEQNDISASHPDLVEQFTNRLEAIGNERPPMPVSDLLMTPALPWVYGQRENTEVPKWLIELVTEVRDHQPRSWPQGQTPWPQAPKDGKIVYTGDGR